MGAVAVYQAIGADLLWGALASAGAVRRRAFALPVGCALSMLLPVLGCRHTARA